MDIRKQGLDIHRIEPVRPVAELAGDRHGPLLFEDVTHLVGA